MNILLRLTGIRTFFRIVEQIKQTQEMTEQLKAINPIKWTQLMNCIRQQANEIIFAELIFNWFCIYL